MDELLRKIMYSYFQGLNAWEIFGANVNRPIVVNDGPLGLRKPIANDFANQAGIAKSVCLLSPSALASSFDESVCYKNGKLLADDCISKNVDVLLAPGINIKRSCLCGRNFEYFSEDPYLTGLLASNYIRGIEENSKSACVKHYACNNQEEYRMTNSSELSLRALNEIYLSAFKYVIKHSSPSFLMTSYNRINGVYVNESEYLLQKKLREEYAFKGTIVSDWTAVVNKGRTIRAGLNVEMPPSKRTFDDFDCFYNIDFNDDDINKRSNEITYSLNNVLNKRQRVINYDFDKVHQESRLLARDSLVLLKNENNIFPLKKNEKILVIGDFAAEPHFCGGGSAYVNPYKSVSFIDTLKDNDINFAYIKGYEKGKYLLDEENFKSIENYYDKIILFVGQYESDESEGGDRKSISLRQEQKQVIEFLVKNNIKFSAIVITGSVLDISSLKNHASGLLLSYLCGEAMFEAIYDVLYGYSPSGRLPETWISSLDINPIYDQLRKNNPFYSYYDDDIFVGYRYYDMCKNKVMINYPFGYGLSYINVDYKNYFIKLKDNHILISLDLINNSKIDGNDVIQIYVGKNDSNVYRPIKELKAIKKVYLTRNSTTHIDIMVDMDDLAIYNNLNDKMEVENGKYQIYIAKNVDEVLQVFEVEINGVVFQEVKEVPILIRKENPSVIDFTWPVELVLNNEKFREMIHNNNPQVDIDNFFKSHQWMIKEPIKNLMYTNDIDIDFKTINEYFPFVK